MLAMHNNAELKSFLHVILSNMRSTFCYVHICEEDFQRVNQSPSPINLRIFVQWCSRTRKAQSEQRDEQGSLKSLTLLLQIRNK